MTTAEHARAVATRTAGTVLIAGVPWPAYKVLALLVGVVVALVVAVATATAAPAVLSGSGAAALVWLGLGWRTASRR